MERVVFDHSSTILRPFRLQNIHLYALNAKTAIFLTHASVHKRNRNMNTRTFILTDTKQQPYAL